MESLLSYFGPFPDLQRLVHISGGGLEASVGADQLRAIDENISCSGSTDSERGVAMAG